MIDHVFVLYSLAAAVSPTRRSSPKKKITSAKNNQDKDVRLELFPKASASSPQPTYLPKQKLGSRGGIVNSPNENNNYQQQDMQAVINQKENLQLKKQRRLCKLNWQLNRKPDGKVSKKLLKNLWIWKLSGVSLKRLPKRERSRRRFTKIIF